MFPKLCLVLLVVLQFTHVYGGFGDWIETVRYVNRTCHQPVGCIDVNITAEQKVREEIFNKMCLTTRGIWGKSRTPHTENIQFFPILEVVKDNMVLIRIYHEYGLAPFYPKNEFLKAPYELGRLLDKLTQSSNIKMKFKNTVFVDKGINEEYFHDLAYHYHSNMVGVSNAKSSNALEIMLYSWMSEYTSRRTPKKEKLWIPGLTNFQAFSLQYAACWDTKKNAANETFSFYLYYRHRALPFHSSKQSPWRPESVAEVHTEAFNEKKMLAYYNCLQRGYEAIKIPYKNANFSMAVLLPYKNQNLKMFLNFLPEDYLNLMEGLREKEEYINYTIPILNLSMVTINENGTIINFNNPLECAPTPVNQAEEVTINENGTRINSDNPSQRDQILNKDIAVPKEFVLNRPFVIVIYHEETKFALWQGLIGDPTSKEYNTYRFLTHEHNRGKELEYKFIY